MARSTYKVLNTHYPYFITSSIVDWLPIFAFPEIANIILKSLCFMQTDREVILYSYVILENHLHMIVQSTELQKNVRAFKSYTAREIINSMLASKNTFYLSKLRKLKLKNHRDSEYQVWQEGYHPKQISDEKSMKQKMEYIHNNPVKRGYVSHPCHWRYSSASNYLEGSGLIPVTTNW